MAANKIKGLTVEIGGDTTKLGKALENVNKKSSDLSSELGEINRLLKLDPGNTELLAQKQKVLASAVDNTADKLNTLKTAEKQVQEQFKRGEVSEEQVRALQREIVATESKMDSYKRAVKETADEVKNLGQESEDTSGKMASVLGTGLKTTATAAAGVLTAMTASTEATREYRADMGKLETAFTTAGHSSEAATKTYKDLQSILGDSGQAVEAANHLAQLATTEEDLAKWTDIATGVYATFGASLPVENITEAANETAKTGTVTGGLADAINWAKASADQWKTALGGNKEALAAFEAATAEGASAEDAFNAALAECSTEQERQALITNTLNGLYSEASTAYKTNNADVIAANAANEELTASLAEVGAEMEPLITQVKEILVQLLEYAVPVLRTIVDNLPIIAVGLAGVTAAMVAFKIASIAATAASKGMTLAQYAAAAAQGVLNAVMSANPIGLIILGITALVVAVMAMVKHWDAFGAFFKKLWQGIKDVFSTVVDWIKENWMAMLLFLVNPLAGIFKYCYDHFEGFRNFIKNTFSNIKKTFLSFVDILKGLPGKIWNAIIGAVNRVKQWGTNMVNAAKTAASNLITRVVSTLTALPGKVWGAIKGAVQKVAQWGTDMAAKGRAAATNLVNSIREKIAELPGKVVSIGKDLVTGLWNGIKEKLQWLKNKVAGFASDVLGKFKSLFGVNSPSRETAWVGEMLDEGLAKGVEDNARTPLRAMRSLSDGMLDEANGLNGVTLDRQLRHNFTAPAAGVQQGAGVLEKLDQLLAAVQQGQSIYLDGNTFVGSTAVRYDNTLGQRRVLAERGAL